MKKGIVGSMSEWAGVLKDFFRQIQDGSHTLKSVVAFNEHRLASVCYCSVSAEQQMESWKKLYEKLFGFTPDLAGVKIPPRQPEFDRLIVITKELCHPVKCEGDKKAVIQPCNWVFAVCEAQFGKNAAESSYNDLDGNLNMAEEQRHPSKNSAYAIWVRDRVEADEENKKQSANDRKGLTDETLLERMLHELKFFDETGEHLDIKNMTLCAGSRSVRGVVPRARFLSRDGKFFVDLFWCRPGDASIYLRSRSVVSSLPTSRESGT